MAMTSCTECDGAVSTEAANCPKCGAPPDQFRPIKVVSATTPKVVGLFVGAAVLAGGLVWAGQPDSPSAIATHPTNVATAQDATPVAPAPRNEPAPPPEPPPHNFAIEQDGEYGYEPAVSETERAAGTGVKEMIMVRYMGESGGVRKITSVSNGVLIVMSCKVPCEVVKQTSFVGGQQIQQDMMRVAPGTLISEIEDDVDNDQLKIYRPR